MITCAGYKFVYLNPEYDPVKENHENSNTESCEEESKNPISKKEPKISPKMSAADTLWRRRLEENANKNLVEEKIEKENPDRPVVDLNESEKPKNGIKFQAGKEFEILAELVGVQPEENNEKLTTSVVINLCLLHSQSLKEDEKNIFIEAVKTLFKEKETELVGKLEIFKNEKANLKSDAGAIGQMIARLPILHELFYWSSNSAEISIFWKRALNLSESEILPLTNMTSRLIQKCISLACETMVNHIEELLTKSPFEMEVPYGVISVLGKGLKLLISWKIY